MLGAEGSKSKYRFTIKVNVAIILMLSEEEKDSKKHLPAKLTTKKNFE